MAEAEEDLVALITREQQGFRRILFAGFAALIVLVAMSAALGVYYYNVANSLGETSINLQRQAFDARLTADRQTNQVANLERAVRRTYDEFRVATIKSKAAASRPGDVINVVGVYLERGGHSLNDELLIENTAADMHSEASSGQHALIRGAAALLAWDRAGEQIAADAPGLPSLLADAKASFEKAQKDSALVRPASTGLAWVDYIYASSSRSNYALGDCDSVFKDIAAASVGAPPGPQPLYWRAQCERKLGRSREALQDYALALRQSGEISEATRDEAELTLAMNAFHGVGTQLIATFDTPEAELKETMDLATSLCGPGEAGAKGSPRMLLARSCLDHAINLRRRLHQTDNQLSGSRENVSFSFLRDGDFDGAFANAAAVERTGLFPWNELLRALSAKHLTSPAARKAETEALQNVRFYAVGRFNPCELEALLNANLLAEARAIVESQHKGESLTCPKGKAQGEAAH